MHLVSVPHANHTTQLIIFISTPSALFDTSCFIRIHVWRWTGSVIAYFSALVGHCLPSHCRVTFRSGGGDGDFGVRRSELASEPDSEPEFGDDLETETSSSSSARARALLTSASSNSELDDVDDDDDDVFLDGATPSDESLTDTDHRRLRRRQRQLQPSTSTPTHQYRR